MRGDDDFGAFLLRRDGVLDGVLDERLEEERGQAALQRGVLDVEARAQPVLEAYPFDLEIELQRRKCGLSW